jgi:EmrB/QacA subfamily drug resistance transporter
MVNETTVSVEGSAQPRLQAPDLIGLNRILILLCVYIPSFMINLDSNIVAVSLSSIEQSLKVDFAGIEWVISAYTLTFASLVMPAGALADRFGRKRMLVLGLGTFTIASFLCGAAPTIGVLNAGRALQGVGAAMQLSSALAILSHSFHGVARARAFAFWGSVIGIAISLGPVIGGFITQSFGWQWAFYVNVPIGLVMIALTLYAVTESKDPHARRVDIPGFLSFSSSLLLITYALITGNRDGWGSRHILTEFAAAAALFGVFLAVELLQQRPMLDLRFFRRPTYIGANIAGVAFATALLTMLTYLPIFFQSGLDYRPQAAGLLMLPMAIPLFIVPRLVASHLTHRFTGRALLTAGLALVSAGLLWIALEAPHFDYWTMLGGMLVMGIGAGILNGETAKVSMTVIPPERAGMASGVSGTVRFTGIVVGFAALGAILYGRVATSILAGLPTGLTVDPVDFIRSVAAGDLAAKISGAGAQDALKLLAERSFGAGYQAIFLAAAAVAGVSALLTWLLVRATDTAPLQQKATARTDHLPIE